MAEVALQEMPGGKPPACGVVAGNAGDADLRVVECQVHHGNASPPERPHEVEHGGSATDGGERAVAGPALEKTREAVRDHHVPAVLLGEACDAAHPHMADGRRHQENIALGVHGG